MTVEPASIRAGLNAGHVTPPVAPYLDRRTAVMNVAASVRCCEHRCKEPCTSA